MSKPTYFDLLGLERRYHLDLQLLEERYHAGAREHHPDRHVRDDARARTRSALHTAELTQAYRALKDPVRRAEYLLEIEGLHIGDERGAHKASPEFLAEVMELREALEDARAARDRDRVALLGQDVRARYARVRGDVDRLLAAYDGGDRAALPPAGDALIALRYYRRFLDELEAHEESELAAAEQGEGAMSGGLLQIGEPGASPVKEKCATGRVVGIDLGTTNSLVATVVDGAPRCLPVAAGGDGAGGERLLPSAVEYFPHGRPPLVGALALAHAPDRPRDVIVSVKRFMGRGPSDAETTRRFTPYDFATRAGPVVRFRLTGGKEVNPIEVSAEILKALRARAEAELGGPLDGAVITVPAYFDDAQRQATKDAGRLAGLEVLRLLNEPTAAALAYGLDKRQEGTFAVYDLGGGTFDISILKLTAGVFEVKSTGGDTALGGDDMDRALAELLLAKTGLDAATHGGRALLHQARALKHRLTTETAVEGTLADRPYRVTRAELDQAIAPILVRTGAPCRRALKDAGLAPPDLDGVILVGGATRVPAVRAHVRELFQREPLGDIDPDQVVALGAAVQADLLAGSGPRADVLLLDVIPLSLGLEMMGGVVEKVIPRNSTIPTGAEQTFTTYADNQTGFDLHVVQGERETAAECRSLARFQLKGLPPMPAGMARLAVTFLVDSDGILHVTARDEATGKEASCDVKPSYGLTDEEVERMLLESYEHAEEDVKTRLLSEARVEAQRILQATRGALARDGERLLSAEERAAVERAAAALDEARAGTDHHRINQAIEALDRASQPFAERRMEEGLGRAVAGRSVGEIEARLDRDRDPPGAE